MKNQFILYLVIALTTIGTSLAFSQNTNTDILQSRNLPSLVTLESLLNEMVDRQSLARLSQPDYTCRQFSSYDRDSVAPDQPGWYANWDRSQFIRTEQNQGRKEHVMLDAEGPGAIVRFWSTWSEGGKPEFSNGTLRFYLDGSDTPAIESGIADILSGHELVGAPLSNSVSPETAYKRRGHNLYFPIPYAKHCKITYESPEILQIGGRTGEALYYQINYRTYEKETQVESFTPKILQQAQSTLRKVQEKLTNYDRDDPGNLNQQNFSGTLDANQTKSFRLRGPAAVRELAFSLQAEDIEQALRSTILEMSFDRNQTVWCPIGDFFGTGHKINPYRSWYTQVTEDGLLSCYWIMPFERSAQITLHNLGDQPVQITRANIRSSNWQWDQQSLYFHANWKNYANFSTGTETNTSGNRAFDINYIDIKGRGKYVGDTLTVFNGTAGWWGEGDEKIYIDGETFPSHFGTGTEDYYGYAWCRPEFFEAPFQAQPNGQGNLRGGFAVNCRFRALDAIPFNRSLDFDMEMFHSRVTKVNYAPTTYWYAQAGAVCNIEPAPQEARRKIIRDIEEISPVFRVAGALEAEKFNIKQATGGTTQTQASIVWNWSGNAQLWWIDGQPGNRLTLEFEADQTGRFDVEAGLTKAVDYGIVKITINGQTALESLDLYNQGVIAVTTELGKCNIKKGVNQIEITIIGANQAAVKRHMFGLDYLKIK